MTLLIDIFGFLTVMLHGLALTAQSVALGGALFLVLLAYPLAPALGADGPWLIRRCAVWITGFAIVVAGLYASHLTIQLAVLTDTLDLSLADAFGADFARFDALAALSATAMALLAWRGRGRYPLVLLLLGLAVLFGGVANSHAMAREDGRYALAATTYLHQLGGAAWLGGIPFFLIALNRIQTNLGWAAVGRRYSQISMAAVTAIGLGGLIMSWVFIATPDGVYGTAYGVMVSTKACFFVGLLCLGAGNYRLVERLRRDPATPVVRLKRFAEVEIGVGVAIFFGAAAITSLPVAVDLTTGRVTMPEIVERLTPQWPRLVSPDHDLLAIPALQAELDRRAAVEGKSVAPPAFVPGAGLPPPNKAEDIAWSEYNHHWSGLFVVAIGLLALVERLGVRAARHWPLIFLGLALFLLIRSDPETWPLGEIGFFESFRDPEVVQHRIFVLLIVIFALFEWAVRTGHLRQPRAALVFPLLTAVGGGLLLAHSHSLGNIRQELLIEITHVPLALFGVAGGWARWLELRLPGRGGRIAGWVWPVCFIALGAVLLIYREA